MNTYELTALCHAQRISSRNLSSKLTDRSGCPGMLWRLLLYLCMYAVHCWQPKKEQLLARESFPMLFTTHGFIFQNRVSENTLADFHEYRRHHCVALRIRRLDLHAHIFCAPRVRSVADITRRSIDERCNGKGKSIARWVHETHWRWKEPGSCETQVC